MVMVMVTTFVVALLFLALVLLGTNIIERESGGKEKEREGGG